MALLAWWSAPEAKLITKFNKNYTQSHFVHMLQTLPVSSNSEVLIMFPEEFDINSCIIEISTTYRRKKLRSLTQVFNYNWFFQILKSYIKQEPTVLTAHLVFLKTFSLVL